MGKKTKLVLMIGCMFFLIYGFFVLDMTKKMDVEFSYIGEINNIDETAEKGVCFVNGTCLYETKENYYIEWAHPEVKNKNYKIEDIVHSGQKIILSVRETKEKNQGYIQIKKENRVIKEVIVIEEEK